MDAFVVISRACEAVSNGANHNDVANDLYEVLERQGWLNSGGELPSTEMPGFNEE